MICSWSPNHLWYKLYAQGLKSCYNSFKWYADNAQMDWRKRRSFQNVRLISKHDLYLSLYDSIWVQSSSGMYEFCCAILHSAHITVNNQTISCVFSKLRSVIVYRVIKILIVHVTKYLPCSCTRGWCNTGFIGQWVEFHGVNLSLSTFIEQQGNSACI